MKFKPIQGKDIEAVCAYNPVSADKCVNYRQIFVSARQPLNMDQILSLQMSVPQGHKEFSSVFLHPVFSFTFSCK